MVYRGCLLNIRAPKKAPQVRILLLPPKDNMKTYKIRIKIDDKGMFWVERKRFHLFWIWEHSFVHRHQAEEYIETYCDTRPKAEKPIIKRCNCE